MRLVPEGAMGEVEVVAMWSNEAYSSSTAIDARQHSLDSNDYLGCSVQGSMRCWSSCGREQGEQRIIIL